LFVTGRVFISYSHGSDGEYVERLAEHLIQQGIAVWFDREIISGDRWASLIRDQIDSCVAMVVVMSPAAEASVWVNREIIQAEEMGKPIHPLLVKGRRFFRLADVQYEDVTGGQMPPPRFVDRLRDYRKAMTNSEVVAPSAPEVMALHLQHNDAKVSTAQGEYAAVIRLRRTLADQIPVLGVDHPDTLMTRRFLADNLAASGDRVAADSVYRELYMIQTRVLGADHPQTLTTRRHLAVHIGSSGDPRQAVVLFRELSADMIRVLGADHPETYWTRRALADSLAASGGQVEAEKLLRELGPDQTEYMVVERAKRAMQDWSDQVRLIYRSGSTLG
jgi:hypothetical protein